LQRFHSRIGGCITVTCTDPEPARVGLIEDAARLCRGRQTRREKLFHGRFDEPSGSSHHSVAVTLAERLLQMHLKFLPQFREDIQMRRSFAIALFGFAISLASVEARADVTGGGEVFCVKKDDLLLYIVSTQTKQLNGHKPEGCMDLRKGTRYQLIDEDRQSHIKQIHLYAHHGPIDGYMMSIEE
jgi:hypothetical protein